MTKYYYPKLVLFLPSLMSYQSALVFISHDQFKLVLMFEGKASVAFWKLVSGLLSTTLIFFVTYEWPNKLKRLYLASFSSLI
jgi:hypothetical protein